MTHIDAQTPIKPVLISHLGANLARPECVLALADGGLIVSNARGGVTHIGADGGQKFIPQKLGGEPITGSLPNGLAGLPDGGLAVANMGTRRLERMALNGETEVLCDEVDGEPLGLVNFVLADNQDRLWFTVSTRREEFMDGFRRDVADGYIGVFDGAPARIVADGLSFPNEIRFDVDGKYLYVAETTGKRVRRCKLLDGPALGAPEPFGPTHLGDGFPDGIAFDREGNLWVAMVVADRLLMISPDGGVSTVLDAGKPEPLARVEAAFLDGSLERPQMAAAAGAIAPLTSSIAFGGPGLDVIYLGSLMGSHIASFPAPIPGLPMAHWR